MDTFLQGVYSALVTPMSKNFEIDYDSFKELLVAQKKANISGVVVCGTTGETPTLTAVEKENLIIMTVDFFKGEETPVIVGTGSNSTKQTIENSKKAVKLGADGVLVVTPYYNRPNAEGLFQHFEMVAKEISPCPVILYDVPSRTGSTIPVNIVIDLAKKCSNIVGIKDATGDLGRVSEIKRVLPHFHVVLGDDGLFFPGLCLGASGVISVASNIIPEQFLELYKLTTYEKLVEARTLHNRLYPLLTNLFIESNPIPIKEALKIKKIIRSSAVRLPLSGLRDENRDLLEGILREVL